MNPDKSYIPHAGNLKRALRHTADRCRKQGVTGDEVLVFDIGIVSTDSLQGGLVEQPGQAIKLITEDDDRIVFLVDLEQFGVPYQNGYMPLTATKFVAWLTRGVTDEDEAFDILIPYLWALRNLAR